MQPNGTLKIILSQIFIKLVIDDLNIEQRRLLSDVLCKVPGMVTSEVYGYAISGKPDTLYNAIYKLCNSFSIELV